MGVISVSLSDENIKELDRIQQVFGLNGRSEAVRTSISAALAEIKELEEMTGEVEGVLVIVRGHHDDPWMIQIQGTYDSIVKTQMHSHLKDGKCLEVMVVSSDAGTLSRMIKDIKSRGKADYIRFVRG